MKHVIVGLLLLGLGLGQALAGAQEELTERLQKLESIKAHFVQTTRDGTGTVVQEAMGRMKAKRPGLFFWHANPPLEQVIVADGKKIWVYDPDLEQATLQKLDNQLGNTPALLLSGSAVDIGEAFDVASQPGENGEALFLLRPKAPDALFESLRMVFVDDLLTEMQLADSLGQRTTVLFESIQLNADLSDSEFEFRPPPGTDIIEDI